MVELKEYEPKDYMKEGDINTIRATRNKFASEHPNVVNAISSSTSSSIAAPSKPIGIQGPTPALPSSSQPVQASLAKSVPNAWGNPINPSPSNPSLIVSGLSNIGLPPLPTTTTNSNPPAASSSFPSKEPISPLAALNATADVLSGSGGVSGVAKLTSSSSSLVSSTSGVIGKPKKVNTIVGGTPADIILVSEVSGPEMMLTNSKAILTLRVHNKTPSSKVLVSITKDSKATNSLCTILTDLNLPPIGRSSGNKKPGINIAPQSHADIQIEISSSGSAQYAQLVFGFKFEHAHAPIKFRKGLTISKEQLNSASKLATEKAYRPDAVKRVIVPVRAAGTSFRTLQRIEPTPPLPEAGRKYPLSDKILKEVEEIGYAKDTNPWGGKTGYKERMHNLLFSEEAEQLKLMRSFDLPHTLMFKYPTDRGVDQILAISVPSLSEKRPSIVPGDTLYAWVKGTTDVEYEGYIYKVQKDSVLIAFADEFHNHVWKPNVEFTVRFTTNRHAWLVNHVALDAVSLDVAWPSESVSLNQNELATVEPYIEVKESMVSDAAVSKNANQMRVINLGLNRHYEARNVPLLLFGPFGTGKTKTLVELIYQITKHRPNSKILVCAPSNSAADVFAVRLAINQQFNKKTLLRLYASTRKAQNTPSAIVDCCYIEQGVYAVPPMDVLKGYKVVVSTCANAFLLQYSGVGQSHFTHIIIDEAAQVMEPDVLIPLTLADAHKTSIIMAGDPKQLGPRFQNKSVSQRVLGQSIMERLSGLPEYTIPANPRTHAPPTTNNKNLIHLFENYRSHPAILGFASNTFYDGKLITRVDTNTLPSLGDWEVLGNPNFPIMFYGVEGTELCEDDSPSYFNHYEAHTIALLVQSLLNDPTIAQLQQHEVGVIAPFFKQIQKIRMILRAFGLGNVIVSSIQEMQGKEFKAIFISTVRSSTRFLEQDTKQGLGFINDPNSLNTAVTRSRCLLVVIGDPYVVSKDPSWRAVMDACLENATYAGKRLTEEEYYQREAYELEHKDDPPLVVPVSYEVDIPNFMGGQGNGMSVGAPSSSSGGLSNGIGQHMMGGGGPSMDNSYSPYSLDGMFKSSQGFEMPASSTLPYSFSNMSPLSSGGLSSGLSSGPVDNISVPSSRTMVANAMPYEPSQSRQEPSRLLCSVDGNEFLYKVGDFQTPHAIIVNSGSAMEVRISTLGSALQLSRRGNIISVILEPVAWSTDRVLYNTNAETQRLDIAIPLFNNHVEYLQSSSLLKIIFHKAPAPINPQLIEEPFQPTMPGGAAYGTFF